MRTTMAQRSVFTQTTQPKQDHTTTRYRWMNRFFTNDVSPDNYPIIKLQQRAIWIGLALTLQAVNEIPHHFYLPYLDPFGSLIPFALIAGSFIAMAMAFRPTSLKQQALRGHPRHWQRILLIVTLFVTIVGSVYFVYCIVLCFLPPEFSND